MDLLQILLHFQHYILSPNCSILARELQTTTVPGIEFRAVSFRCCRRRNRILLYQIIELGHRNQYRMNLVEDDKSLSRAIASRWGTQRKRTDNSRTMKFVSPHQLIKCHTENLWL